MPQAGRHFVAGLGSGVATAVLLQPLDLLKTRVQQSGRSSLSENIRSLRRSPHIIQDLWRGTVPSALRTGFGSALYFTTLNSIRRYAHGLSPTSRTTTTQNGSSVLPALSGYANLLAGASARVSAGFVLMPLTVIKVRFESSFYNYRSIWSAASDILRKEGARGFFSGFGATAIRDGPSAGLYVLFYELLKPRLGTLASRTAKETQMQASSATLVNFGSGVLAGAACSAVSNPFDAIKTRIQLQPQRYRNIWHAARTMVMKDGVKSLWDGLALRMGRKALSSALAWTVYEELIRRSTS